MISFWGKFWCWNHAARWCLGAICVSGKILWNKCDFIWRKLLTRMFFAWNTFWCNMMSLNFALNFISIVLMYTCHASSCFSFCIYIFVHIFTWKYLKWKLNKHLIVYIIKVMFFFLSAIHFIKLKVWVLRVRWIFHWFC